MQKNMTSNERTEQRAVVKFCVRAGMTPTNTWKCMCLPDETRKCSRTIVFDWHKRFRDGRITVEDDSRVGRPTCSATTVDQVRDVILTDRRRTIDEIADIVGVSHGAVFNIIKDDMNMNKVCARWVPKLLSDDESQQSTGISSVPETMEKGRTEVLKSHRYNGRDVDQFLRPGIKKRIDGVEKTRLSTT